MKDPISNNIKKVIQEIVIIDLLKTKFDKTNIKEAFFLEDFNIK